MHRLIVAPAAERDLIEILAWTHEEFGEQARLRYEALLIRAISDIVSDPNLSGSMQRPEIADSARTYHLVHSRNHVAIGIGRVKRPRHFLLYRSRVHGAIEIGRVLHDSMDFEGHVPEDYR